jgi:hypothetical protein
VRLAHGHRAVAVAVAALERLEQVVRVDVVAEAVVLARGLAEGRRRQDDGRLRHFLERGRRLLARQLVGDIARQERFAPAAVTGGEDQHLAPRGHRRHRLDQPVDGDAGVGDQIQARVARDQVASEVLAGGAAERAVRRDVDQHRVARAARLGLHLGDGRQDRRAGGVGADQQAHVVERA